MLHVTDYKILYELVRKRITEPSERRLLLDSEADRNDSEAGHIISKWVNMKDVWADCLNKGDQRAGDYLRFVLKSRRYQVTEDTMAYHRIPTETANARKRRKDYLHPHHKRPAEQEHQIEGMTLFEDAVAEVGFDPNRLCECPR